MKTHNKSSLKEIRRELRQKMTPAEALLWERLRGRRLLNTKFQRQHSIGNYIVDFYCAHPRLIIELDGIVHEEVEQKEKDKYRDENLNEMKYTVLRFSNNEVLNSIKEVLAKIAETLHNKL